MNILDRLFGPPNIEKMKTRRDIKGLTKALSYKKETIRNEAVTALKALLWDDETDIRNRAEEALTGVMPPEQARNLAVESNLNRLIAALKDKNLEKRRYAAIVLAQLRDTRAVYSLVEAIRDEYVERNKLANDMDDEVRRIGGMAAIRGTNKLNLIQSNVDKIVSVGVADAAMDALTRMGLPATEPLVTSLKTIAKLKDSRLRSVYGYDTNWQVRMLVGKLLGKVLRKLGDSRSVDLLSSAVKDEDKDVRAMAVYALGALADQQAKVILTKALNDEDKDVSIAAKEALTEFRQH